MFVGALLPWGIFGSCFKKGSGIWMSLFLDVRTHVSLKGEFSPNVLSTCLLNIPVYVSPPVKMQTAKIPQPF